MPKRFFSSVNPSSESVLERIVRDKKEGLEARKQCKPLKELLDSNDAAQKKPSLKAALSTQSDVRVICEYKSTSPSKGFISNARVEEVVRAYEANGAAAVSVLTEENYFKSSLENLRRASAATRLPLMRKDFILEEYEVYEAKAFGASAVLLIVGVCPDLRRFIELSSSLDLDALVECHSKDDIEAAVQAGADLIGVNNRDLRTLRVDLNTTIKLAECVPRNALLVSESGIATKEHIRLMGSQGVDAVLVGASVMSSQDIGAKVRELVEAGRNVKHENKR